MARTKIDKYAVTMGSSSATFIADANNADQTLATAFSTYDAVFTKPGTYNFSNTFSIASNKTLLGDPNSRPTFKLATGVNKTVITNADASTGFTTGVTIESIIIDQQGSGQNAGGGIVVTGIQNWTMYNVRIKQSYKFNFLCLHQSAGVANKTGTVTLTKGSASVTGSNTLFTTELSAGDIIKSAGDQFGRVASITNNTSLTLTLAWGSTTESGVTYKVIQPNSGCTFTNMVYEGTVNDADASGYGFFDNGIVRGSEASGANTGGCGFVPDHAKGMQLIGLVSHGNDNSGISLETCENCTITNPLTYSNVNGNGVQFISGTSNCTVSGGIARNHTNNGFVVSYNTTSAGIPTGNIFSGCTGTLNGGYAFRNDGGDSTEYSSVTGTDNDTGGLISNTSNSHVPDNINVHNSQFIDDRGASKSQDRGIWIVTSTNGHVTNNTALNSQHVITGIQNDAGAGCTLSGNTT